MRSMPRSASCLACSRTFTAQGTRGRMPATCSEICRHAIAPVYVPRMITKICVECGTPFETRNRKTVCCGPTCGHIRGKRLGDEGRRANAVARRTRTCQQCSKVFIARNPSGSERRAGRMQTFCSVDCASAARRAPAREAVE
jgi:hypothetical protein